MEQKLEEAMDQAAQENIEIPESPKSGPGKKKRGRKAKAAGSAAKKAEPKKPRAKAKKAKAVAKVGTGKRYTPEERKAIADYALSMGRGGLTAAAKKFNVSMLSVARFMKDSSGKSVRKNKGKVGRPKGKRGRPPGVKAASNSNPIFTKQAKKRILNGLKRMSHGIELLAEAFGHIT